MSELTAMNSNLNLDRFLKDVESHVLAINLDNGVYRDITIKKPGSSDMHYNITTRPGYLMFSGDMGCFVFERLLDMFNFFRDSNGYRINPGYWHEKIQAQNKGSGIEEFSADKAERRINEHLEYFLEELDLEDAEDQEKAKDAKSAVEDLIYKAHDFEPELYTALNDWDPGLAGGLCFADWREMDFTDYSFHYLWACYAIVHAIKLYDAYKVEKYRNSFEINYYPTYRDPGDLMLLKFDLATESYVFDESAETADQLDFRERDSLVNWVNTAWSSWKKACMKMENNND